MAIVAGLLVVSYLLYMVDVWATERIDGLLLAHYGPELYERYTSALQEVRTDKVANLARTCRILLTWSLSLNGQQKMR